jgi:hypothetical protein
VITMSALPRLLSCPASAVLPSADIHNPWADAGTEAHEDLAELSADHEYASIIPPGARSEVRVAYDVVTRQGRILGEGGGRDYGAARENEIAGSIDVLGADGDSVVVIDWKTGFRDVDPARRNWQLWGYALAACRALGLESAIVRVVYTQSRFVDEHAIDPFELAEFADRLEHLHGVVATLRAAHARGEPLRTVEGSWCRHCGCKAQCPSKVGLLTRFLGGGGASITGLELTPAGAAEAYRQIVRVEQIVGDAKRRLNTYVDDHGPIDLGDGVHYGRYVSSGNEALDGAVTSQAIRDVLGDQAERFEQIAVERSTSKAAIARAAKEIAPKARGAATRLAGAVIERVRELGGTRREERRPIGEFRADKHHAADRPPVDHAAIDRLLRSTK